MGATQDDMLPGRIVSDVTMDNIVDTRESIMNDVREKVIYIAE